VSELPADPFRTGDEATDALREGATVLDALDDLAAEDGGRPLVRGILVLPAEDLRAALLAAVTLRHVGRQGRLRPWVRRLRRWARRAAMRLARGETQA